MRGNLKIKKSIKKHEIEPKGAKRKAKETKM